jgi:hypothetical protein
MAASAVDEPRVNRDADVGSIHVESPGVAGRKKLETDALMGVEFARRPPRARFQHPRVGRQLSAAPQRLEASDVATVLADRDRRIAELEAQVALLRKAGERSGDCPTPTPITCVRHP